MHGATNRASAVHLSTTEFNMRKCAAARQPRTSDAWRFDMKISPTRSLPQSRPGQNGGVNHLRLKNLMTGTFWEHSFRAELKVEELLLQRHSFCCEMRW